VAVAAVIAPGGIFVFNCSSRTPERGRSRLAWSAAAVSYVCAPVYLVGWDGVVAALVAAPIVLVSWDEYRRAVGPKTASTVCCSGGNERSEPGPGS
jgi:hypothetical protein